MAAKKKGKKKKSHDTLVIVLIVLAIFVVGGGVAIFATGGKILGGLPDFMAKDELINPLTGEICEEELPGCPVIVSIDNVEDAVPQSWLSKADMVYEFPVEGELTRLQAIYYGEFPDDFGPVRSARPYFIDLTREYQGIFVAHGWSEAAKEYLMSGAVPYINAMNSDLDWYRVEDKSSPHDSYIAWSEIKSEIDAQGWWSEKKEVTPFQFLSGAQVNEGEAAGFIDLGTVYSGCEFTYDPSTGTYARTVNGEPYIDRETGENITVYNVIIQYVESTVLDGNGRLAIDMCAGGDAILFTNGVAVKGTWSRSDLDSRTVFVDTEGNEFKLTPGNTWVHVTDQNCTVSYQ